MESTVSYSIIKSPVDDLMLIADETALIGLSFVGGKYFRAADPGWKLNPQHPVLQQTARELHEYFSGTRNSFAVPMRFIGTEFQKSVWANIAAIPYGETITYGHLAQLAGSPSAVRAAGATTGRNPIAIIVPCHRVMGKNGTLTGFAGGLDRKRFLLDLESSAERLL